MRTLLCLLLVGALATPTPSPGQQQGSSDDGQLQFLKCPVPPGGTCNAAQWCIDGHMCVGGICVPFGGIANGQSCLPTNFNIGSSISFYEKGLGSLCASGYCDWLTYRCAAKLAIGSNCALHGADPCNNGFCSEDMSGTVCAAKSKVGENCYSGGGTPTCEAGLICNSGTCITGGDVGQFCDYYNPCKIGAYCKGGLCVTSETNGSPCASDNECQSNLCNIYQSPFVCVPPQNIGEGCLENRHCASNNCYYSYCAPQGGVGTGCEPYGQSNNCTSTTYCDTFTYKCVAKIPAGASCSTMGRDNTCSGQNECKPPTPKCVAFLSLGAFCSGVSSRCGANAFCSYNGTCTAKLANNAVCDENSQCTSGFCDAGPTGTCAALKANGVPCSSSRECSSGNCLQDTYVCGSKLTAGQVCGSGMGGPSYDACGSGLTCSQNWNSVCAALKADGAQCDWPGNQAGCASGYCNQDRICDPKFPASGPCFGGMAGCADPNQNCYQKQDRICKARLSVGMDCETSYGDPSQCETGSFCNITSYYDINTGYISTGRCTWLPNRGENCTQMMSGPSCRNPADVCVNWMCQPQLMDGATCSGYGDECKSGRCNYNYTNGTYYCATIVGLGAYCDAYGGDSVCTGYCNTSTYICESPLAAGSSCMNAKDCQSGVCYSGQCMAGLALGATCGTLTSGLAGGSFCINARCAPSQDRAFCQTPLSAGGACLNNTACEANMNCLNNVCSPRKANGAACLPPVDGVWQSPEISECINLCVQTAPAVCGAKFAFNSSCANDFQCQSGYCYSGRCASLAQRDGACTYMTMCPQGQFCDSSNTCVDQVPAGQNCTYYNNECLDSACEQYVCVALPTIGQSCMGRCAAGAFCDGGFCRGPKGEGEWCSYAGQCGPGLWCDQQKSQCLPKKGMSAPGCSPAANDNSCPDTQTCHLPTGVCGAKAGTGANCTQGTDCASGDCDGGMCQAVGRTTGSPCQGNCPGGAVCVRPDPTCVAKVAAGGACQNGDECVSGICMNSVCSAPAAVGASCLMTTCVDNAFCKIDLPRCAALPTIGQVCAGARSDPSRQRCATGLWCSYYTGTCMPYTNPGTWCGTNSECGPDFVCASVTYTGYPGGPRECQAPRKYGDSCDPAQDRETRDTCGPGLLCDNVDYSYKCTDKRLTGSNCSAHFQCFSGRCQYQKCVNMPSVPLGGDCYDDTIGYGNNMFCQQGYCKSATNDFLGPWTCSNNKLANGQLCPWTALIVDMDASLACNSGFCTPLSGTCTGKLSDGANCGIADLAGVDVAYKNFIQVGPQEDACQGICKGSSTGWKCASKSTLGQACTNDTETESCANSWCQSAGTKCSNKRAVGASCNNPRQCLNGWCINGVCEACSSAPVQGPTRSPVSPTAPTRTPTIPPTTKMPTKRPTNVGATESPTETPTKYPTRPPSATLPPSNPTPYPTEAVTQGTPTTGPPNVETPTVAGAPTIEAPTVAGAPTIETPTPPPTTVVSGGMRLATAGKWIVALVCCAFILL